MCILLAVILKERRLLQMANDDHISHVAFHRGYFLFLKPTREPVFPHPPQLLILFALIIFNNLIIQTPFLIGDLSLYVLEEKVEKVNYVSWLSSDLQSPCFSLI